MQFSIGHFLKSNKVSLIVMLLGGALLLVVNLLNTDDVMSGTLRLLRYVSLLFISTPLFVLLMKGKKVVLGNVILFILLLFITELVCFFILGMPPANNKDFGLANLPEEHISTHLGTVPYADSVYHHVLVKDNDTVYDVRSSIDSNCLRINPDHQLENDQFALFFGCSIAFGEGLDDNETLPYHFQESSGKYNSYNLAFSGYGTNHMLARMEYQDLSKIVVEQNGKAFYIFFWDHIFRSIGSMEHYCGWVSNAPYYTFDDGELIRKKAFKNGRYLLSETYEAIYQTNIIKKFGINFPLALNTEHYHLVTEMILQSKIEYREQFGNDDFYVVFYPTYADYTPEQLKQFQSILEEKGIDYLDLNDFLDYGPEHTLGGDPHPSSNTNQIVAKELLNRVTLKNN
jgi:hypothetical protein